MKYINANEILPVRLGEGIIIPSITTGSLSESFARLPAK